MRLIIREYLESLKEREELDAILPDLLSELGLTVYSRPGRGTTQDGVDVAAFGSLDGDIEKVHLFSIKSGNLTRSSWDGQSNQSLRPSLNQIIDSYIPNRLPLQYKGKPIIIYICLGGVILEQVQPKIEGYKKENTKKNISFKEWNGDKLSELILKSFLREELLPSGFQSLLRKSLVLLDNPETSYKHFMQLVRLLSISKTNKSGDKLRAIRQLNISLWILYTWCREANNLEAAYLSAESSLLYAWEIYKSYQNGKDKLAKDINSTYFSILLTYQQICNQYISEKILPHTKNLHAISSAVKPSSDIDVNLKLFDLLGRISLMGIWVYWGRLQISPEDSKQLLLSNKKLKMFFTAIKQLISNNPILFAPIKDDQAIDITLALWFLSLEIDNHQDIHSWLLELINSVRFNFYAHNKYPCNLYSYHELLEHPVERTESYREEVTAGSILYPIVATFSALLGFDDIYNGIQEFKEESLKHCNFQLWYPDDTSENYFYTNSSNHGATLSSLSIEKTKEEFLEQIFSECHETPHYNDMSAVKGGMWPLIFLGCRHYRLPIPVHLLKILQKEKKSEVVDDH